jgi:hypothetical protein
VFVVGAPRSGTSLLYKLLCLHPDTAWISNWYRRVPGVPVVALLNRLGPRFPATRRRVWFGADVGNAYVYGGRRPLADRLFPMPVEGEPIYRHCGIGQLPVPGSPDPGQAARLRRTFVAMRRWAGGSVVVSKRIANNERIPLLAAAFPDAVFVHLVRDGRAVVASLAQVDWWEDDTVWWYGGTPRQWRLAGGDPWELAARHWVRELASIREGLSGVPAAQRLELRYEDLLQEPVPAVHRVAALVALQPRPAWSREVARLRYPSRAGTWRTRLSPEAVARIETIQGDDLRRHGYLA